MASKLFIADQRLRERRQQQYQAAPTLAQRFPKAGEMAVSLSFRDPDGKTVFSPYRQLYLPQMQAYFEVLCPFRDCSGGGFDLEPLIARHLRGGDSAPLRLECEGRRSRPEGPSRCELALTVRIEVERPEDEGR